MKIRLKFQFQDVDNGPLDNSRGIAKNLLTFRINLIKTKQTFLSTVIG